MSQEIVEQARLLGEMLAKSQEVNEFRDAEAKLANDPVAQELISQFQAMHAKESAAKREGGSLSSEDQREFAKIEEQVDANATISAYLESQARYTNLLDSINFLIMKEINGGDSCSTQSGCSSCSGCGA